MPTDPIASINRISHLTGPVGVDKITTSTSTSADFGQMLTEALTRLNQQENVANQAITGLAVGDDIELHQVMLSMQEADLGFQLALQVRNKLVEAYQEVMRMQV